MRENRTVTVTTRLPTRFGNFTLLYYRSDLDHKEHLALIRGAVKGKVAVPVRIHSECLTGDVFGSLRCDCGEQLHYALQYLSGQPCGVLLYLRQEGRGIGLYKKLLAYNLQDQGLDTVEANLKLGHQPDERDYQIAAQILETLGVRSIRLLTNNPHKIQALEGAGIEVVERIPIEVGRSEENLTYLRTKAEKLAHLLNLEGD